MAGSIQQTLTRISQIRSRIATTRVSVPVPGASGAASTPNIGRDAGAPTTQAPTFNTLLAQQLQQSSLSGLAGVLGGDSNTANSGFGSVFGGLGSTAGGLDPITAALLGLGGTGGAGVNPYLSLAALSGTPAVGGAQFQQYRYNPFRDLELSSSYGDRPTLADPDVSEFHHGTDYALAEGTPLPAIGSGTVTEVDMQGAGGLGRSVTYVLDTGERITYGHLTDKAPASVAVGQRVGPGHIVGTSGNTGASTGPHVHIEIMSNGARIDPHVYLSMLP